MNGLFTASLTLCFSSVSMAQETNQSGSEISLAAAAQDSEAFCVASFQEIGTPDVGSPGHTYFGNAVVKVIRNLRSGNFEATKCSYSIRTFPQEKAEANPTVGEPLLMIGVIRNQIFNIKKITVPSAENLGVIEKALRMRNLPIDPRTRDTQTSDLNINSASDTTTLKSYPPSNSAIVVATATPGPKSLTQIVAEGPAAVVERKASLWPWVMGISVVFVIVAAVLKRRS